MTETPGSGEIKDLNPEDAKEWFDRTMESLREFGNVWGDNGIMGSLTMEPGVNPEIMGRQEDLGGVKLKNTFLLRDNANYRNLVITGLWGDNIGPEEHVIEFDADRLDSQVNVKGYLTRRGELVAEIREAGKKKYDLRATKASE